MDSGHNFLFLLFTAAFIGYTELMAVIRRSERTRDAVFMQGVLMAGGILFFLNGADDTAAINILMLHVGAVAMVLLRLNLLSENRIGERFPVDLAAGFLLYPFAGFGRRIAAVWQTLRGPGKRNLLSDIISLAAAGFVLAIALESLSSLSSFFLSPFALLQRVFDPDFLFYTCFYFVLSLPVGAYFYGLMTTRQPLKPRNPFLANVLSRAEFILLYSLSALYGVYFLVTVFQGFSAANAVEIHARAFDVFAVMVRIVFLNCVVFLMVNRPDREAEAHHAHKTVLRTVLCVMSLLFCLSAGILLCRYIAYGFTARRLYACWILSCALLALVLNGLSLYQNVDVYRTLTRYTAAGWLVCSIFSLFL
ncbi:MAG: DUF4173 domain-containing protein [Solobacterium sp.]|nr:DUF4173 domain-containing protein [Solobacterium sp.]